MKKFLNDPESLLAESLDGFAAAHREIVTLGAARAFARRARITPGKVGLLSGGGSGHEPTQIGFVGHGMLDAACPGEIFTAPTPDRIAAAAASIDAGAGLLFIVTNYDGDLMNFDMARELVENESGRRVATVITNDDVAVEASTWSTGRRGVAGTMIVERMVGAAAEEGRDLAALKTLGDAVNATTRSIGVALTSCTVPAVGKPTFAIGDDEIEMGVGIHGEPGRRRVKLATTDSLAAEMVDALLGDLSPSPGASLLLLVNGFGGTPLIELYGLYNAARRVIEGRGLRVARSLVGNYVTSLDMAGGSITLTILDDDRERLWDSPIHTAALRWGL